MRTPSILLLASCALLAQDSVQLPLPGTVRLTPMVARQSFQDIWAGNNPVRLGDSVRQWSGAVSAEIGLTRNVAADVTAGYSNVDSRAFGGANSDRGLTDTRFGLRWGFRNGSKRSPALAARIGGIVRGSYTPNYPFSAGDGGSGAEVSILAGQPLGESASAFADIGYRRRNAGIPADVFGSAGLAKSFGPVSASLAYRHARGLSGSDIGNPGFTFPGLREVRHVMEGGLGFSDRGRRGYYLFVARSIGGRNTGDIILVGAAAQFSVRLPWWR